MDRTNSTPREAPQFDTRPGALADLDAMVAEVGASYPMIAYAAGVDQDDEAGAMDAMILAGLVTP